MSFGLYAAGYAIVIVGLVYVAHLMHMPQHWILGRRDRHDRHWATVGREGHPPKRPRLKSLATRGNSNSFSQEDRWSRAPEIIVGRAIHH